MSNDATGTGRGRRVRKLYRIGSARWYDSFRNLWTLLTSRAAETELDRLLQENAAPDCRVLDIGCGTGHNLGRLQRLGIPFASYRGVDLTEAMLAVAREHYAGEERATFEQADLRALAGEDEHFDVVLCTWVASHLERPREVFEIAYDRLAPGGHALLLTLTPPHWSIAWWFTPLVRLFQARYVPWQALQDLPGLETKRSWTAGMTTLLHLARPATSSDRAETPRTGEGE